MSQQLGTQFDRSGLSRPVVATAAALIIAAVGCAHQPGGPGGTRPGVEVIAGGGTGADGGLATAAKLVEPYAVVRAPSGDLYLAEAGGHRIRRIDAQGIIHTVAGTGEKADGGDGGSARQARLNTPHHLALAPAGAPAPAAAVLYIADTFNRRVRTLALAAAAAAAPAPDADVIQTVIGNGSKGFAGDGGPANQAITGSIFCLAFDAAGRRLFFADLDNHRIRAVDLTTGLVTTVAGNGEKGVPVDGSDALSAPLLDPRAVAVDRHDNIYIVERSGHALRVVDAAGKIRTVAGTGEKGFSGDGGPALQAKMNGPKHLTVDRDDSVLIVDTENHVIRRYDPRDGRITRVAGTGVKGSGGIGGPPQAVQLDRPHGVYVDSNGDLLLSDSDNHRVLRVRR